MTLVLTWLGAAFLAGLGVTRIGMPPLVGYLLAGYGLHYAGLELVQPLPLLAELGIQLLLFSVGLKIQLRMLVRREVLGVGGLHLLLVAGVSGLMFLLEQQALSGGLLLGASLAFSSTVLAVKVLDDNGDLESFQGRTVMGILILQDLVAVGLLSLTSSTLPSPWALSLLLLPLLKPLARLIFSLSKDRELRLLLGLLFAFAGGSLAELAGVSKDLGAFLMGVLLAGHPQTDGLSKRLWSIKEVLLVAFFLEIGLMGLPDERQLLEALGLLLLLPLQGILFFVLMLIIGLRARTSFLGSLALMTYSEFALIAVGPVVEDGLLDPGWEPVLGLAVAASLAFAALLNRYSGVLFGWLEPILVRFERQVPHPDQLPVHFGSSRWLVVGMGQVGRAVYDSLNRRQKRVMGLDSDPTRAPELARKGYRVLYGDAEDPALWSREELKRLRGVVVAVPEFRSRLISLEIVRRSGFRGTLGTIADDVEEDAALFRAGADIVFHPLAEGGERLADKMIDRVISDPLNPS